MKILKKLIIYCVGLLILSFGVSFAIISNLGVSPISSIPYVSSLITKVDLGICTTITLTIFVIIQFLLLGKKFKISSFLQILSSTLFGCFVSVTNFLTSGIPQINNYFIQLLFCFIGMICVALGVYLYLGADLLSLSAEGVMQAMCIKFSLPFATSKIIFDCSMIVISVLASLIFLGKVEGVREGSIICAVGVGICIKFIQKITFIQNLLKN